jgi:hypothetical protein
VTYEGRQASQLEVLEIIHFTPLILLRLGDFRIRVAFTFAASATFLLDVTVHFPRKRVHIVAIGIGKESVSVWFRSSRRETHPRRIINSDMVIPGYFSNGVR